MKKFYFLVTLLLTNGVLYSAELTKEGAEKKREGVKEKKESKEVALRESVITADKIEFDNKEGVILFDENVLVDDEQFIMRSDRLIVFMEGTNDVDQIMAIGNVSMTNENRSARCEKAVYTRKDGQIVLTENATLEQIGKKGGNVSGKRIAIWLDDERMEVSPGRVILPPGTFKKVNKKLVP
ncbi:MAG: hypothetical protein PF904_02200 [Kiritimatiellae bacterium]|nr:hypothetical protein [Kiritimatiellia bacterium]